jgi:hypothetical protein
VSYRKWYVYEVLDEHDACIYVGKGTASRMFTSLAVQEGVGVRAVAYFNCELAALAFERDLIRERRPAKNKAIKREPRTSWEWVEEAKHDPREMARRLLAIVDYAIENNVKPRRGAEHLWRGIRQARLRHRAAI